MPSTSADPTPPPQPARAWWRLLIVTVAILLALAAVAWIAADLRGRALWRQHLAELEAAGRSFDPERLFTPAVEGTFWADPFVREWSGEKTPRQRLEALLESDPDYDSQSRVRACASRIDPIHSLGTEEVYEGFYPELALTPGEAARRLMETLSEFDKDVELLRTALRLAPSSRWPDLSHFDPEEPICVVAVCGWVQILIHRARCRLYLEDAREALSEIEDAFLCLRHTHHEAVIIESLVASEMDRAVLRILSEGLDRGSWDATLLELIDQLLEYRIADYLGFDFIIQRELGYMHVMSERWVTLRGRGDLVDGLMVTTPEAFRRPAWIAGWAWLDDSFEFIDGLVWRILPPGVLMTALVERDRWAFDVLLDSEIPLRERIVSHEDVLEEHRKRLLGNPGIEFLFAGAGAYGEILARHEDSLILLHTARAAVAAERHRLDTGRYPAAWEEFVPRWLDAIPADPWSGGSLVYRLDDEGRPVIYSVGRNGIDEGGTPSRRRDEGDLVWRYSAAE